MGRWWLRLGNGSRQSRCRGSAQPTLGAQWPRRITVGRAGWLGPHSQRCDQSVTFSRSGMPRSESAARFTVDSGHTRIGSPWPLAFSIFGSQRLGRCRASDAPDGSSRWENAVRITTGAIWCAAIRSVAGIPSRTSHLDVEDHQIRLQRRDGRAMRAWPTPRTGPKRYIDRRVDHPGGRPGPGSPIRQQAMVSKAIQCGFESHPGHNSKAHTECHWLPGSYSHVPTSYR
jgi:hypothetical protein